MKSLKILFSLLTLTLVTAPTQAQERKGGMTPDQQISRMEQVVGKLSAEQKAKITDIMSKTREKGREKMRDVPKEQRKEKMAGMIKEQGDQIRAVLTPEQQKKYDAMASRRGGAKGKGEGKGKDGAKRKKDK